MITGLRGRTLRWISAARVVLQVTRALRLVVACIASRPADPSAPQTVETVGCASAGECTATHNRTFCTRTMPTASARATALVPTACRHGVRGRREPTYGGIDKRSGGSRSTCTGHTGLYWSTIESFQQRA